MALRNVPYAGQTAPQMVFLDQTFADVSALGIVPCTAAGTNLITLTPNANTPTISAYANYLQFSFVCANTTTGAVTLQVGSLSALNVYLPDGTTQAGNGTFQKNFLYVVAFNSALNGGANGWVIVSAQISQTSSTIASGSTVSIGAAATDYIFISGTTTITAFDNVQSGIQRTLEFQGILTLTNNSTSLILPGGANIITAAGDTAIFRSEGSGNWRCISYSPNKVVPLSAFFRGYLAGMTLSNDSSTPSRSINVSSGVSADSTNSVYITLSSVMNKTISAAWASGAGQGSLGNGLTLASSTWYHVFSIINNNVPDFYIDNVSSAANTPTNTTAFRRIGSIITNGASTSGQIGLATFVQKGDEFLYISPFGDVNVSNLATVATLFTLTVPTGVKVNALFNAVANNVSAGVTTINSPDQAVTVANAPAGNTQLANAANGSTAAPFNIRTNPSGQIRAVGSNSNTTFQAATYGFVDTRGRFD